MNFVRLVIAIGFVCTAASSFAAVQPEGSRAFLRRPDVHGDMVVFTAEGDLWLGSISTGAARRITSHSGVESYAHFSPDGTRIAFSAQYDGGNDVYVMPVAGGEPRRLTYEPRGARVLGWTPDGQNVVYRAFRMSPQFGNRLCRVPATGGSPVAYAIPQVEHAALNSDGKRVAYVPVSAEWNHWFRYRGGQADDVWLADLENKSFQKLTDHPAVDTTPVWAGNTLYFVSERDGFANLAKLDPASRRVTPVTSYRDYELRYPSTDGKLIVFQHGNGIALYDPAVNKTRELSFALSSDRIHARARRTDAGRWVNDAAIGPTGKRALVEMRGQLWSLPAEEGDARPVAPLPGSRTQYPAWSPDGKQVAFVSDRSGEEQVWVCPAAGGGEPRQLTHDHKGPLGKLVWSPDGKWIAVGDRELRIMLLDVATGAASTVDQTTYNWAYDSLIVNTYRFSPDGKWLTYAKMEPTWNMAVYLYDIAGKKSVRITNPEMNCTAPAFDSTGKYVLFISDRHFDPTGGGASHFFFFEKTARVSLVTLAADTPSPFLPANDEEAATEPSKPAAKEPADSKALPVTRVDLDGIASRVVDVPVPASRYQRVEGIEGRLLLLDALENPFQVTNSSGQFQPSKLISFDIKKKETQTIVPRVTDIDLSFDRKKLLLRNDKEVSIVDANTGPVAEGRGKLLPVSNMALLVDPAAEWKQLFQEAWRIARDFFYDPNMHGVDWDAVKRKYATEMDAVADRSDLNDLLGDMIAELNTGHAYVGGGAFDLTAPAQRMGYLAANLEPAPEGNAYRITKLLEGDGFELDTRSPMLTPGVNVKPGDYILAVSGQPVRTDQDIQSLLIDTAGKIITLTVNSAPKLDGARQVRIKPLPSEEKARYYDWVAGRREYIRTHGGEKIGYVQLPDMMDGGLQEFAKHYYPNIWINDGMIFDVRNNGGGFVGEMLLLQIAAKPVTYMKPRSGGPWTDTDWAFAGHSAALCNENTGSNGEWFSDNFQRLKIGPVIGARTWGGLVGSGNGYPLMDGGKIYIPNYGAYAPDGKWIVEGTGAEPDIAVENDPAAVMAGRDPQLDRAIAYLNEKIKQRPPLRPKPPPYPNKALKPDRSQPKPTNP